MGELTITEINCVFAVFFIVIVLFIINNSKRKSKRLTLQHNHAFIRNKALEIELNFQKECTLHLQLTLDIKQKSEQVFLEKLKEIRLKKHKEPEEIIRELQVHIINLLQIDKKNINKTKEKSSDTNIFTQRLIALNKNLSEQELRLCCYFKMNLSSKEIAQLEQHLALDSIKVLKNRIKKKLGLSSEENLNQFLNSLFNNNN
jgi:DNA-binding CsgD family transcriptional regulator/predicted house-cleaning noncanonical NTP pyrophosphatase (MazG superfamily)